MKKNKSLAVAGLLLSLSSGLISEAMAADASTNAKANVCRTQEGFLDENIQPDGIRFVMGGDDGKGIGGTGHEPMPDEQRGIGGTGMRLSKAYITGTIYAYGSICVNGVRVTYDDTTPVFKQGQKISTEKLQMGQTVNIVAEQTVGSTSLKAQKVELTEMLGGEITSIDSLTRTLTIMNERVHWQTQSDVSALRLGQKVAVSGLRERNGSIKATAIRLVADQDNAVLMGKFEQAANGQGVVGQTPVDLPDTIKLKTGQVVTVSGLWNGRALQVEKVIETSVLPDLSADTYISFEGYVEAFDQNKAVKISGLDAKVRSLTCSGEPLELGERLVGMGRVMTDGSIYFDGLADIQPVSTKFYGFDAMNGTPAKTRLND